MRQNPLQPLKDAVFYSHDMDVIKDYAARAESDPALRKAIINWRDESVFGGNFLTGCNNPAIADILLNIGVDPDHEYKYEKILDHGSGKRGMVTTTLLLDLARTHNDPPGAGTGIDTYPMAKFLLEHPVTPADPNKKTGPMQLTPLQMLIKTRDGDGFNPNRDRDAAHTRYDYAKMLLEYGADPLLPGGEEITVAAHNKLLGKEGHYTALDYARVRGDAQLIELLSNAHPAASKEAPAVASASAENTSAGGALIALFENARTQLKSQPEAGVIAELRRGVNAWLAQHESADASALNQLHSTPFDAELGQLRLVDYLRGLSGSRSDVPEAIKPVAKTTSETLCARGALSTTNRDRVLTYTALINDIIDGRQPMDELLRQTRMQPNASDFAEALAYTISTGMERIARTGNNATEATRIKGIMNAAVRKLLTAALRDPKDIAAMDAIISREAPKPARRIVRKAKRNDPNGYDELIANFGSRPEFLAEIFAVRHTQPLFGVTPGANPTLMEYTSSLAEKKEPWAQMAADVKRILMELRPEADRPRDS